MHRDAATSVESPNSTRPFVATRALPRAARGGAPSQPPIAPTNPAAEQAEHECCNSHRNYRIPLRNFRRDAAGKPPGQGVNASDEGTGHSTGATQSPSDEPGTAPEQ